MREYERVFVTFCRLPIDTLSGEPVYAEAAVRGKKKEAVVQCALNACRMLDAEDILRESKKGTVAPTAAFSRFALPMEVLTASHSLRVP